MELKKLVKNTSYLMLTKVFQFIAGIFRSKLNAVLLGTAGVGIVNQLTFLTQSLTKFTLLSMSEAVVKQIAESRDKDTVTEVINSSLKSYIILILSFMSISIILFNYFSDDLTKYVFGDIKYIRYFFIALFTFPILVLNSIPFAILKGFKNVKAISQARVLIIIVNLLIFIPLIILYKLDGAIIFIPSSYILTLTINYLFVKYQHLSNLKISFLSIMKAPLHKGYVKELLLFSGVGLSVGSYSIFSEFTCR
ncbi:MAG: oligosaccharide flippase family protein, partial [Mariniphaga sp.]|nr:oligosaccharide flippase family protein [Mariniphaga sp.]